MISYVYKGGKPHPYSTRKHTYFKLVEEYYKVRDGSWFLFLLLLLVVTLSVHKNGFYDLSPIVQTTNIYLCGFYDSVGHST